MTAALTVDEARALRLRAQRLATGSDDTTASRDRGGAEGVHAGGGASERVQSTGAGRVADTVRHMFALQGQDWRSSRWALGVRAPGTTRNDVHDAFNAAKIVRSWPMRSTLHVVAAEDIGWMQTVTNRRVLAGAPRRREYLGMSDAVLEQLVDVAVQALASGATLNRDELSAAWTDAGIEWKSNWRYHLIWWLCQNGIAVLGPVEDGEPRLVLATDWIQHSRTLEGDDALVEFVCRYTAARGPVQAKDLAWWAGLNMTDAKRGFALAAEVGRVQAVDVRDGDARNGDARNGDARDDGGADRGGASRRGGGGAGRRAPGEFWCTPELLGSALAASDTGTRAGNGVGVRSAGAGAGAGGEAPEWLLLPAFDEHLLGYTDRSMQLDPELFERIVPGRNGMFLATVVHRGQTVATWKRAGTPKRPAVQVTPLPGHRLDADGLAGELGRWGAFQGFDEVTILID